jgi:hypothetical protein
MPGRSEPPHIGLHDCECLNSLSFGLRQLTIHLVKDSAAMQPTFKSTRAGYIVSMVATVWTLNQIIREADAPPLPLPFVDAELRATDAFVFLILCLGLAACFYGFAFLRRDEGTAWTEPIGDCFYILSLSLLPFYLLSLPAYLIARDVLGIDFVNSHLARFVLIGTLPLSLVVGFIFVVAWQAMLAHRRQNQIALLEAEEQEAITQANRSFSAKILDQGVISYWDACVHKLQRSLLMHNKSVTIGKSNKAVEQAISRGRRAGILSPEAQEEMEKLKGYVAIAKSKEMISAKDADAAREAAKQVLGRIPVDEPA